ncbi:TrkA domain-containing protein [Mycobacterium tuberculosis]|nr:TrkA domain-containing protein [Mycobacterium tuberculosis]
MDVKEVLLPGVGLRYEFTSYRGDRIGIVARRSGGSTSSCMAAMIRTKPDRFCGSPMKRPRRWLRFWVRRGSPSDLPS